MLLHQSASSFTALISQVKGVAVHAALLMARGEINKDEGEEPDAAGRWWRIRGGRRKRLITDMLLIEARGEAGVPCRGWVVGGGVRAALVVQQSGRLPHLHV